MAASRQNDPYKASVLSAGTRIGHLTLISDTGKRKNGYVVWKCSCDCGAETTVAQSRLICGTTTSCGCAQKEAAQKNMHYTDGTSIVALENAQKHLSSRNTSGHTGVMFNKASRKWIARITFKGITHNLGSFVDKKRRHSGQRSCRGDASRLSCCLLRTAAVRKRSPFPFQFSNHSTFWPQADRT